MFSDGGDPVQTLSCLVHLQQAGFLSHASAVIFGHFKDATDRPMAKGLRDAAAVRRDIATALKDVPVFEFGPDINTFCPIPFNTDALLCNIDGNMTLTVPTGGRKYEPSPLTEMSTPGEAPSQPEAEPDIWTQFTSQFVAQS